MVSDAGAEPLLRRLAAACAMLVLVVVAASAYLRLGQAGFSCADWPACYGRIEANQVAQAAEPLVFWARLAHRLAAMGVTFLVLIIVVLAFRRRANDSRPLGWALAALVLTLLLALLGRWTPGTRIPAVTLGNLLGGFALIGVLWRLRVTAADGPARPSSSLLLWLCAALLALQVALGGLVSASFAGLSCLAFPGCGESGIHYQIELLSPFRSIAVDASGVAARPPGLTGLVALHRLAAAGLALACLALAWRWWSAGRRGLALRLAALIVIAYALGIAIAFSAPPLLLVFGHNFVAALLVLTLAEGA